MEAQQSAGIYAFQHCLRLVHADSARASGGDALLPRTHTPLLLPYLFQLLRCSQRQHHRRCGTLLPDGLFPAGGAFRHSPGRHKKSALPSFRDAAHHTSQPAGPYRPVFPLGHLPPAPAGRKLYGPHQRRLLPDHTGELGIPPVPRQRPQYAAYLVGVQHSPGRFHVRPSVYALHAHSGGDDADSHAQRRPPDTPSSPRVRQNGGSELPRLRRLYRCLPHEREEGQHQGLHGVPQPPDTQGQRKTDRGNHRQVPALRQM